MGLRVGTAQANIVGEVWDREALLVPRQATLCDGWHLTAKPVGGRKPPWDRDPDWVRPTGA